jgi:alkylation response protein AidB-like acyl-CoA dehydrogenase
MLWIMWSEGLDTMISDYATQIHGTARAEDPIMRDRLAKVLMDAQALKLLGYRGLAKLQRGLVPAEQSILKMLGSEGQREMSHLALESLGAAALDQAAATAARKPYSNRRPASWFERYLFSFAGTISGGTSEIQRNIIAEHTLGLPR